MWRWDVKWFQHRRHTDNFEGFCLFVFFAFFTSFPPTRCLCLVRAQFYSSKNGSAFPLTWELSERRHDVPLATRRSVRILFCIVQRLFCWSPFCDPSTFLFELFHHLFINLPVVPDTPAHSSSNCCFFGEISNLSGNIWLHHIGRSAQYCWWTTASLV